MGFPNDEEEYQPNIGILNYFRNKGQLPAKPQAQGAALPQGSDFEKFEQNFSDEKMQAAQSAAEDQKSGLGWAQFAAGLGDAMAGRDPSNSARNFDEIRKGIDSKTTGAYEKRRDAAIKGISTKKSLEGSDPGSARSQAFRSMMAAKFPDVVKSYGDSWDKVSADDQEVIFKPLQLKEQIESRRDSARILAGDRAEARAVRDSDKQARLEEKQQGLKTPYGLANTVDDAKQLKEAHESKKNFDGKLQEMIDLRTANRGGAVFNREAVARGQQLSKDLLLEYKNMAKLGVLSSADEAIINAIIPADPLEFNSPLAAIQGQDPILSNLKKFKGDSDKDFRTRVSTRTREGLLNNQQTPPGEEPDVAKYATTHGISYEAAMQIKLQRTSKQAGR